MNYAGKISGLMIDLSGAKNIHITFTGLRDGEKLYEEVLNDAEQTIPTTHSKIMVAKERKLPDETKEYLKKAWQEIMETECHQGYGMLSKGLMIVD